MAFDLPFFFEIFTSTSILIFIFHFLFFIIYFLFYIFKLSYFYFVFNQVVFFAKTSELHVLNKAIIYARDNELCDRIIICHVHLPNTILPIGFCSNAPTSNIGNINDNKNENKTENSSEIKNENRNKNTIDFENKNKNKNKSTYNSKDENKNENESNDTNENTPLSSPDGVHVRFHKSLISDSSYDNNDDESLSVEEIQFPSNPQKSALKSSKIHGPGILGGILSSSSYLHSLSMSDINQSSHLMVSLQYIIILYSII